MAQTSTLRTGLVRSFLVADRVPGILRYALYAILLVSGFVSLFHLKTFGPLPITALLDGWIIAVAIVLAVRSKRLLSWPTLVIGVYLLTRLIPALVIEAPMYDFLQAYRWVFYLGVFSIAVGQRWGTVKGLTRTVLLLIAMALLKALLAGFLVGFGGRPGLLLENNFELALFVGLVMVLYRRMSPYSRVAALVMLAGVTVLAESRSGAILFVLLVVFAAAHLRGWLRIALFAGGVPLGIALVVWIFLQRVTQFRIDRLNFAEVFFRETADWSVFNWIFGTTPISPLSPEGCERLSNYARLYSSLDDGSCYVVILHAFVLRVVFDAGIIGLIIAFGGMLLLMRQGRTPWLVIIGVLAVAAANSASVSGPNSPYVAIPVLLAILISDQARDGGGLWFTRRGRRRAVASGEQPAHSAETLH